MEGLIFVIATIILIILAIITSNIYNKKGYKKRAQLYPAIIIGSGLGIVTGVMAKGSFLETLVVVLFLILLAYSQFIMLTRASKSFKSFKNQNRKESNKK